MTAWLNIFSLDLAVIAVAALVLLVDSFVQLPARALGWFCTVALLGVFVASYFVDVSGAAPGSVYVSTPWVLFFKRVFLVAGALGTLGIMDWLGQHTPRRQAEYYVLMLLSIVGMMVLPGVKDWILLLVAFELMGIPLIVMAAWAKGDVTPASGGRSLAAEAAFKFFVTSAASSAVTLFGMALVTGLSGSTRIGVAPPAAVAPLASVGMLLIIGGMGFKVGAVPFHLWIPDTYEGAPTPFVGFLSVAPKAGGLAALAVVLLGGWGPLAGIWGPAVLTLAGASMVVGNFFALPQSDVRRLLGFSGVAQIGYVLLALAARSHFGLGMALFFIATYVFTNMGVFYVAHAAAESSGGHQVGALKGLWKRSPWLGGAMLVFLLSLAGIPFVVGFWAKLFVFFAAWKAGFFGLVVLGVALAVVGLFYYLGVARSTFMADTQSTAPVKVGLPLGLAIVACLVAVVGLGLWPGPLVDGAMGAATAFLP